MDEGDAALVPSYRPPGLRQVIVGDRLRDRNWIAININHDHYLPAPVEKIAGLTWLDVEGAKLTPGFTPDVKNYTAKLRRGTDSTLVITADPTSSRSAMTINGEPASGEKAHALKLTSSKIGVDVKSPDGTQTAAYTITVSEDERKDRQ